MSGNFQTKNISSKKLWSIILTSFSVLGRDLGHFPLDLGLGRTENSLSRSITTLNLVILFCWTLDLLFEFEQAHRIMRIKIKNEYFMVVFCKMIQLLSLYDTFLLPRRRRDIKNFLLLDFWLIFYWLLMDCWLIVDWFVIDLLFICDSSVIDCR